MENVLYALPLLACPVVMGVMMWKMRGSHRAAERAPAAGSEMDLGQPAPALRRAAEDVSTADPNPQGADLRR